MRTYELILTDDGSPTLRSTEENGTSERMHHFGGALTESLYVYRPAVEWAFSETALQVRVLSLGLGLGYNEWITLAVALQRGEFDRLKLISFEADHELQGAFNAWLNEESSPWAEAYDHVVACCASAFTLTPENLKSTLRQLRQEDRFELRGRFPEELRPGELYEAILYDAFSAKMDRDVWQESQLLNFLEFHAAPRAALATYAATGALKRALKKFNFEFPFKAGYGGKRECTFAKRLTSPFSAQPSLF